YKALDRSTHKKEIKHLINRVNDVQKKHITPERKLAEIVALLEAAYKQEQDRFCKPFLGKRKEPQDFVNKINGSDFQYIRLIAAKWITICNQYPELENKALLGQYIRKINVVDDKNKVYENQIPALLGKEYSTNYQTNEQKLQKNGLTKVQIYQ